MYEEPRLSPFFTHVLPSLFLSLGKFFDRSSSAPQPSCAKILGHSLCPERRSSQPAAQFSFLAKVSSSSDGSLNGLSGATRPQGGPVSWGLVKPQKLLSKRGQNLYELVSFWARPSCLRLLVRRRTQTKLSGASPAARESTFRRRLPRIWLYEVPTSPFWLDELLRKISEKC